MTFDGLISIRLIHPKTLFFRADPNSKAELS